MNCLSENESKHVALPLNSNCVIALQYPSYTFLFLMASIYLSFDNQMIINEQLTRVVCLWISFYILYIHIEIYMYLVHALMTSFFVSYRNSRYSFSPLFSLFAFSHFTFSFTSRPCLPHPYPPLSLPLSRYCIYVFFYNVSACPCVY